MDASIANVNYLFSFIAGWYFMTWKQQILLNHLSIKGHLSRLQFGAIMIKVAMNIHVQGFLSI